MILFAIVNSENQSRGNYTAAINLKADEEKRLVN